MAMSPEKAARRYQQYSDPGTESVVEAFGGLAAPTRKQAKGSRRQRKDNGEKQKAANVQAEAIIDKVKKDVSVDHALGKRVKELRDGGMAWWQIAYQLELPGAGASAATGKSGAARARLLYRKTYGELPGDVVRRSTKASRAAAAETGAVLRKPHFTEEQLEDDEYLLGHTTGKLLRWIGKTKCSDDSVLETEREARVHPDNVKIERLEGGRVLLHFREREKGDTRAQQWRCVCLNDVYEIRR